MSLTPKCTVGSLVVFGKQLFILLDLFCSELTVPREKILYTDVLHTDVLKGYCKAYAGWLASMVEFGSGALV